MQHHYALVAESFQLQGGSIDEIAYVLFKEDHIARSVRAIMDDIQTFHWQERSAQLSDVIRANLHHPFKGFTVSVNGTPCENAHAQLYLLVIRRIAQEMFDGYGHYFRKPKGPLLRIFTKLCGKKNA